MFCSFFWFFFLEINFCATKQLLVHYGAQPALTAAIHVIRKHCHLNELDRHVLFCRRTSVDLVTFPEVLWLWDQRMFEGLVVTWYVGLFVRSLNLGLVSAAPLWVYDVLGMGDV